MPLLERFLHFVSEHNLHHSREPVLLAISGGVDSVVLLDLAQRAGWPVGIAHCNFQLRGAASDGDEDFVRDLGEAFDLPVYVEVFDTKKEAAQRGVSIQMAARDLRYTWLEKIRRREGYELIATAHHLDDSVETVLYNFAKGTGIRGLHGIPVRREAIIRPLLFAAKEEVEAHARSLELPFREDASNATDDYARNKIRHHVVPVLRELNPGFLATAATNLERFRQVEYLYELALERIREELAEEQGERMTINLERLLHYYRAAPTILYELLHPYGFHPGQVAQILDSTTRQPGALFFTESHQLVVDRETLILDARIFDIEEKLYYIADGIEIVHLPGGRLEIAYKEGRPETFPSDPNRTFLDAELLTFPLRLRHWRPGDYFCPLGMQGRRQKIQDFFTNKKIHRLDKDRIWLLETHHGEICWVVGHRLDERFKISPQTSRYAELTYYPA